MGCFCGCLPTYNKSTSYLLTLYLLIPTLEIFFIYNIEVIWEQPAMPDHTHLIVTYESLFYVCWCLSTCKKINFLISGILDFQESWIVKIILGHNSKQEFCQIWGFQCEVKNLNENLNEKRFEKKLKIQYFFNSFIYFAKYGEKGFFQELGTATFLT